MSAVQMSRFHEVSVTVFWNQHLEVSWHASDKTFSELLSRFGVNVIQGDLKETRDPVIFLFRPSWHLFFPFSLFPSCLFNTLSSHRFPPFVSRHLVDLVDVHAQKQQLRITSPRKEQVKNIYVVKYVVKNVVVNTCNFHLPALLLIVRHTV